MPDKGRRMLLAMIVLSLCLLALVILAGVAVSGLLWLAEENASLRSALSSLTGSQAGRIPVL